MTWKRGDKTGTTKESFESKAHQQLKNHYAQTLNNTRRLWRPKQEEAPDFVARAVQEYLYPISAKVAGAAFTRLKTVEDLYGGAPNPTREEAIKAGDPPLFIFDVAVESNKGLLYVVEIVKSNPVSQEKKTFLASIGVPLLIVHTPVWVSRERYIQRKQDEQRALQQSFDDEDQRYLYELRDITRTRCGLPPKRPFISFEEGKMLWEHERYGK